MCSWKLFFQLAVTRRTFGFEVFREWLQHRYLCFQNSAWGHLPFANSIDSIGQEEYAMPEEDWELDNAQFFPNYEHADMEWVPPYVVERMVSETSEILIIY